MDSLNLAITLNSVVLLFVGEQLYEQEQLTSEQLRKEVMELQQELTESKSELDRMKCNIGSSLPEMSSDRRVTHSVNIYFMLSAKF